ncbi:MAG: SWIM zinc finger family protein [Anaerolineales bacterium]
MNGRNAWTCDCPMFEGDVIRCRTEIWYICPTFQQNV